MNKNQTQNQLTAQTKTVVKCAQGSFSKVKNASVDKHPEEASRTGYRFEPYRAPVTGVR